MAPDLRTYTVAETLLQCANDALADTIGGQPDRACVIAGALAWECICGGELTVAITNNYTSSNFPTPSASTATSFKSRCGEPIIVYNMTITMLRCVPLGDDQGNPPSCEALTAYALATVQDAAAIRDGILCCLADLVRSKDSHGTPMITGFTAQNQDFVGPAGACGGSSMAIQIGLLSYCQCQD